MVTYKVIVLALPLALAACGNSTAGTPVPRQETPIQTAQRVHDECHDLARQANEKDEEAIEAAAKFCVLTSAEVQDPKIMSIILEWHPEWENG